MKIFFMMLCVFALSACQNNPTSNLESANTSIKIAGSTSVGPLAKKIAQSFEAANNISIEIQETGSSSGISSAIDGAASIAMSSRSIKDSEKEQGLVDHLIALDALAVVINPNNPISNLTPNDLQKIYQGEITNWNQLGGENKEINIVSRESSSGTRSAFDELVGLVSENQNLLSEDAIIENSTGSVKVTVANNKYAIGYISLGSLDNTVKSLQINNIPCTIDNVINGSYTLSRPFILCIKKDSTDSNAKSFIDFALSKEGQIIVSEAGYVPVNP